MTTPSTLALGVIVGPALGSERGRGDGGSWYEYRDGEHELTLAVRGAGREEARALKVGEAEFALVVEGPLLLLCARFGEAIPWTPAPFRAPRTTGASSAAPRDGEMVARALITTTLVDEAGGTALASRGATLSLDFTRALNDALRERALTPADPKALKRAWDRLHRRAATPKALAAAAVVRSIGSP